VRSAHAVRLPDHVELVPEPRHEPEGRERRVADPVRHAQLLHARAHEVGPLVVRPARSASATIAASRRPVAMPTARAPPYSDQPPICTP
jgi:hypothetical protein